MTAEQADKWKQVIGYVREYAGLPLAVLVARSCRVLCERDDQGLAAIAFDRDYGDLWSEVAMVPLASACVEVYGVDGMRARWVDSSQPWEIPGDLGAVEPDAPPVPRDDTAIGIVDELRERGSALAVVPGRGLVAVQTADRVIDPDMLLRVGARAKDLAALIREHGTDVC